VSDIEIDVGSLSKVEIPKSMSIPCTISELSLITNDVLKVTLQLPLALRIAYLAGQYAVITNAEGICRIYSLATAQAEEQKITLHIRKVKQGAMSDY
jgi:CDP-4-dehydro-6-deoxyglucose reductase